MSKVLFFGDIVGKAGRRALAKVCPVWQKAYQPDLVVANVENLAHGKGVTASTLQELANLGVDVFTSGNHVFDKFPQARECFEKYPNLIRPANYVSLPASNSGESAAAEGLNGPGPKQLPCPGFGYFRLAKNGQNYLVINLGGRVFFENQFKGEIANPFFELDKLLLEQSQKGDIILVDFHCEATSEKNALGWYSDGRVAAVVGTHTHIPTADAKILPGGTAYVTDIGMSAAKNSVIGVKVQNALDLFLDRGKFVNEVEETGPAAVNAVFMETKGNRAIHIESLFKEVLNF